MQSVANTLGKSHSQISQLKTQTRHSTSGKPRVIGDDLAREIEEKFNLEIGWMDNVHEPEGDSSIVRRQQIPKWPFKVAQIRLEALNVADWEKINTTLETLVEARERDQQTKRKAAIG